jgi:hypothetical protein
MCGGCSEARFAGRSVLYTLGGGIWQATALTALSRMLIARRYIEEVYYKIKQWRPPSEKKKGGKNQSPRNRRHVATASAPPSYCPTIYSSVFY